MPPRCKVSSPGEISALPLSERWVCQRDVVVKAFKHAYGGYEKVAFGQDELMPVSNRAKPENFLGGLGMTIIDAMDTMWLMNKYTTHSFQGRVETALRG